MIEFARNAFRRFFVFTLVVLLLGCTIAGGIIGYGISDDAGGVFLGVIVGLFLWFIIFILGGGLIATFLNIDKNIENQNKMQKLLLLHFGVSEKIINEILEGKIDEIPIINQTVQINQQKVDYITNRAIYLFLEPNLNSTNIGTLSEGMKLTFLEKGNDVLIDNINASWFKIRSEKNDIGWCFSGYLRKV